MVVMFDTLCRHFLPSYGNDWVSAPNFDRLAKVTTQFDNFYVGSMPCMPARREMHTGRYNFLHRSWGPLEPFDDSMPAILDANGIHAHKVTDHQHYWEDGGATYHQRFTTFDFVRGQEGDKWIGDVEKLRDEKLAHGRWPENQWTRMARQDLINRQVMSTSKEQPQHITFDLGLEFIERNFEADNWFLQIETFDPHEPFFSQDEFKKMYPHEYVGPEFDWPPYRELREDQQSVEHIRYLYASLLAFCDQQLGRVLDAFDRYELWDDTMLLVNTDHGFLMGEHDWWAKVINPFFQEIAHIPFWAYDPRLPNEKGKRSNALTQTIDLPATILDYFDLSLPDNMQGRPVFGIGDDHSASREAALFGVMGGHVNVTDGRYVYMRGNVTKDNSPLFEYTLMPSRMRGMFSPKELTDWEESVGFGFTKECKLMRIPSRVPEMFTSKDNPAGAGRMSTMLFDTQADPGQLTPIYDPVLESRMIRLMLREMARNDSPAEQYLRLGLPEPKMANGDIYNPIMPSEQAILDACTPEPSGDRKEFAAGNGIPKMPFPNIPGDKETQSFSFPRNLRLSPTYPHKVDKN